MLVFRQPARSATTTITEARPPCDDRQLQFTTTNIHQNIRPLISLDFAKRSRDGLETDQRWACHSGALDSISEIYLEHPEAARQRMSPPLRAANQ